MSKTQKILWTLHNKRTLPYTCAIFDIKNDSVPELNVLLSEIQRRHSILNYTIQWDPNILQVAMRRDASRICVAFPDNLSLHEIKAQAAASLWDGKRLSPIAVSRTYRDGQSLLVIVTSSIFLDTESLLLVINSIRQNSAGDVPEITFFQASAWQQTVISEAPDEVKTLESLLNSYHSDELPLSKKASRDARYMSTQQITLSLPDKFAGRDQLEIVVSASLAAFLWRQTGSNRIILYRPESDRKLDALQAVVGPLTKPVPLVIEVDPSLNATGLLLALSKQYKDDSELTTFFDYSNYGLLNNTVHYEVIELQEDFLELTGNEFPFSARLRVTKSGATTAQVMLDYDDDVLDAYAVEAWLWQISSWMRWMMKDDKTSLSSFTGFSDNEGNFLHSPNEPLKKMSLIECFHEVVLKDPRALCIVDGSVSMSYHQTDQQSTAIAKCLRTAGLREGEPVILAMKRTYQTVLSILGVLKAGGVFIPVDIDLGLQRFDDILETTKSRFVIYNGDAPFNSTAQYNFKVDDFLPGSFSEFVHVVAEDAYAVFTSGTTGKPKGVLVSNKNIANYISWLKSGVFSGSTSTIWLTSHGFDLGFTSLFGALASGGTLHIGNSTALQSVEKTLEYLYVNNIDVLKITPSILKLILGFESHTVFMSKVRKIVLGGEAYRYADIQMLWKSCPDIEVIIHYGPTECTVGCITRSLNKEQSEGKGIIIGKPIGGVEMFVVNDAGQQVPRGLEGQLYIGGDCVATGYMNKEIQTQEKFLPNRFTGTGRIYATGDQVRLVSDGSVEFLGRKDRQVKLNGYRIELEEIESCLSSFDGIRESVVIIRDNILLGYYVCSKEISVEKLMLHLESTLLPFMIPSTLAQIPFLPVTVNGKIDEVQLPARVIATNDSQDDEPVSEGEILLTGIWKEILGKKEIKVTQSYFTLGGDSIKAILIASKLLRLGYSFELRDIFKYPTIRELSLRLTRAKITIETDEFRDGTLCDLGPVQYDFLQRFGSNADQYANNLLLRLDKVYDVSAINDLLQIVYDHHDQLRTVIKNDGYFKQYCSPKGAPVSVSVIDLSNENDAERLIHDHLSRVVTREILLGQPLTLFAYIFTSTSAWIYVYVHHFVIDTISWRILYHDLRKLIDQSGISATLNLPEKTHSYKSWVNYMKRFEKSEDFEKQWAYWNPFANADRMSVSLQGNARRGAVGRLETHLTPNDTTRFINIVGQYSQASPEELLICSFVQALFRTQGQTALWIDLEGHGRDMSAQGLDFSRTIGWFTTVFPVYVRISYPEDIELSLMQVKDHLQAVPGNGLAFGVGKFYLKKALSFERAAVRFNYLGLFDTDEKTSVSAEISKGHNELLNSGYELDISAFISNEQLHVKIAYDKEKFSENATSCILDNYLNDLLRLIEYCETNDQVSGASRGYKELSIEDINSLFD